MDRTAVTCSFHSSSRIGRKSTTVEIRESTSRFGAGLYAANPKRATANPTAEQLLAAFGDITLLLIDVPERTYVHLTPLSPL